MHSCCMQATIDALRSQLEVAHHKPLCATAQSASAGAQFCDSDRAACMRALQEAAGTLEAAMPALSDSLEKLAVGCDRRMHGDSAACGSHVAKGSTCDVATIVKELRQLQDVINAACMFSQVR
jgi:hypothetical protein